MARVLGFHDIHVDYSSRFVLGHDLIWVYVRHRYLALSAMETTLIEVP